MKEISDISKLTVNAGNNICYEGKKISKWWGKTLYYFDKKENKLYCENFSLFTLLFHLCGYKKQFNNEGLKDWLAAKNIYIKSESKTSEAVKEALHMFSDKLKQFKNLCLDWNASEDDIIQLFKDGLDVNIIVDEVNTTALHEACDRGRYNVAKYLIENGANINTTPTEGSGLVARTPLQAALGIGHEELVLLLLEHGADVNTQNGYGSPVLNEAIARLGEDNKNRGYYPGDLGTPKQPKKIIQAILEKDVRINEAGNKQTPLYEACEKGDFEVVRWIVDKGGDVNAFSKYGKPPLLAGVASGNVEIVRFLFEKGANPNPQEPFRDNPWLLASWDSPMMLAVGSHKLKNWKPNPAMLQLLKDKGVDVNQKGSWQQRVALHISAEWGDLETVKFLLAMGADSTIKDLNGKSPADLAREENRQEVASYLETFVKQ